MADQQVTKTQSELEDLLSRPLSDVEQKADCHFFMTSGCTKGDACQYRHSELAKKNATSVCRFWMSGHCGNGESCKFVHLSDMAIPQYPPPPHYPIQTVALDKSKIPCHFYLSSNCLKGLTCPFLHPGLEKGGLADAVNVEDKSESKKLTAPPMNFDSKPSFGNSTVQFGRPPNSSLLDEKISFGRKEEQFLKTRLDSKTSPSAIKRKTICPTNTKRDGKTSLKRSNSFEEGELEEDDLRFELQKRKVQKYDSDPTSENRVYRVIGRRDVISTPKSGRFGALFSRTKQDQQNEVRRFGDRRKGSQDGWLSAEGSQSYRRQTYQNQHSKQNTIETDNSRDRQQTYQNKKGNRVEAERYSRDQNGFSKKRQHMPEEKADFEVLSFEEIMARKKKGKANNTSRSKNEVPTNKQNSHAADMHGSHTKNQMKNKNSSSHSTDFEVLSFEEIMRRKHATTKKAPETLEVNKDNKIQISSDATKSNISNVKQPNFQQTQSKELDDTSDASRFQKTQSNNLDATPDASGKPVLPRTHSNDLDDELAEFEELMEAI